MAAAMLATSVLTSCDDFLEATNKTAGGQTADQFFQNNPASILYSSYAALRTVVNQTEIFEEGTDLYIYTRGQTLSQFMDYNLSSANTTVKSFYVNCYGVINYANGALKYAAPTSKEAYEARFLRAYAYYELTQHFGAVPYVTSYIESASREYPRVALSEIYPLLIEDLKDLYNNSSLVEKSAHDGHVSKQAVAALIAKIELAAGWDLDTKFNDKNAGTYSVSSTSHFSEAAAWAEKAIAGVTLYSNFGDKWLPKNEDNNQEEIFSVNFLQDGDPGGAGKNDNCTSFTYGGYPSGEQTSGYKYVNSRLQQSEKAMYLFEQGDTRYEGTFMTTFYDGSGVSDGYMKFYSGANPDKDKISARWYPYYVSPTAIQEELEAHLEQYQNLNSYASFKAALLTAPNVTVWTLKDGALTKTTQTLVAFNTATNNGTCVRKFDDPNCTFNDQCYRDMVLLHASDLYLVAAEGYLMAGNKSEYWNKINVIRNRAGLASISDMSQYKPQYSYTSAFGKENELDLLLDERARELYAERTRWEDLRRTKQLARYVASFNSDVQDVAKVKWYRPIPDDEIQNNDAISQADQNEGY